MVTINNNNNNDDDDDDDIHLTVTVMMIILLKKNKIHFMKNTICKYIAILCLIQKKDREDVILDLLFSKVSIGRLLIY